MEQEERNQFPSPMPVLPRLDCLAPVNREETESMSERHSSGPGVRKMEVEDPCKALSSGLDEVCHRGTLIERIARLENLVLQLSLKMEEGNTSRSSTCTLQIPENTGQGSDVEDVVITYREKQESVVIQEEAEACGEAYPNLSKMQGSNNSRARKSIVSTMHYKKWLGCFH